MTAHIYYSEIYRRLEALMEVRDTVKVAIDGCCGSGKSTLAAVIGDAYDCNIFHMDHFFLVPELRTKERLREIGGNVDYVRFRKEVLEGIKSGQKFSYSIYDCKKRAMSEKIAVLPKKLSIIEGAYSMHPTLVDDYDLKIFLKIGEEEQMERIRRRNGEEMLKLFMTQWIPLENAYFDRMGIEEKSDLTFTTNHFFP